MIRKSKEHRNGFRFQVTEKEISKGSNCWPSFISNAPFFEEENSIHTSVLVIRILMLLFSAPDGQHVPIKHERSSETIYWGSNLIHIWQWIAKFMINLTSGIKFRKNILVSGTENEFSLSLQEGLIFIMCNREKKKEKIPNLMT